MRKSSEVAQHLEAILRAAKDAIFTKDVEGRFVIVNPHFARLFGKKITEIIGRKASEVFPGDFEKDEEFDKIVLEKGKVVKYEKTVETNSGREKYLHVIKTPLKDSKGEIFGVCGIARDISAYKEAEKALLESETRFRLLTESSLVGVYLIQDGTLKYVNPAFARIFGYKRSEIVNKLSPLDLVYPEDRPLVEKEIRRRLEGRVKKVHYTFRGQRKDGGIVECEALGVRAIFMGKPAILGTILDVTEKKKIIEALKRSEKRFRAIVENSNDLIWILDRNGCFLYANRRAQEVTGYSLDEWRGKSFVSLLLPEDVEPALKLFQEVLRGKSNHCEARIFRKDGSILCISFNSVPIIEDGKVVSSIYLGQDITQRKELERKLTALYQAITRMAISDNIDEILEMGLDATVDIMQLRNVSILLIDEERRELYIRKQRGVAADVRLPLDCNRGVTVWVAKHGVPKIIADTRKEPLYVPGRKRMLSEIAVPLKVKDRVIGVINAESEKVGAFTEDDLKLLQVLALGMAAAIENIKLIESVKTSEARFQTLVTSAIEAIVWTDADRRILLWNRAAEELFGYTEEEALGKRVEELIVPDTVRDEFLKNYEKFLKTEKWLFMGRAVETLVRRKDGKVIPVEFSVSPMRVKGKLEALAIIRDISERKEAERKLKESLVRLRKTVEGVVRTIARIVEMRDPYTAGHQRRVAELACAIAEEMGLDRKRIEVLRIAGLLHDIGKISVPAEILSKPGKLTDVEMKLIMAHPKVGYEILKNIDFDGPVAEIVLQHHERMDGSGYPRGLKGDEILLEARILGVADVVEAMASHRPYRPALGIQMALDEIKRNKGKLYDPQVVDACIKVFKEKGFKWSDVEEKLISINYGENESNKALDK